MTTSAASSAFTPGSGQLAQLAALPRDVPVLAIAGSVRLKVRAFTWTATIGDIGDGVVSEESAQAGGNRLGTLGGSLIIDCGDLELDATALAGFKCWHGTETTSDEFLSTALIELRKAINAINAGDAAPSPPPSQPTGSAPSGGEYRTTVHDRDKYSLTVAYRTRPGTEPVVTTLNDLPGHETVTQDFPGLTATLTNNTDGHIYATSPDIGYHLDIIAGWSADSPVCTGSLSNARTNVNGLGAVCVKRLASFQTDGVTLGPGQTLALNNYADSGGPQAALQFPGVLLDVGSQILQELKKGPVFTAIAATTNTNEAFPESKCIIDAGNPITTYYVVLHSPQNPALTCSP